MSLYNKPTYIPNEFLKATKQGWVDIRTNEVLVAIANLDELISENEMVTKTVQEQPKEVETKTNDQEQQLEETQQEVDVETKPKRKPKQQ